jgi:hypothetical protein
MKALTILAAATAIGLGGAAYAQDFVLTKDHMVYDMCDLNKDGMVTKEEFLKSQAQMWDDAMKKMKVSAAGMNKAQYEMFVRHTYVQ